MTVQLFPLVVTGDGASLVDHLTDHSEPVRGALRERGAVLFRDFTVDGLDDFDAAVRKFSGQAPLTYAERSSPRVSLKGNIYSSTEYPAREEIFLHNENSYQSAWPRTLYFFCVTPPETQGATPLADTRRILSAIDPDVVQEFERRGWMVVRNYREDIGLPWQNAFNTDDRSQVEQYCRQSGLDAHWKSDGGLQTKAVRKAVHRHPETGDRVWFNHATVFHVSTLPAEAREGLMELCGKENLPSNTYYGDGADIPDDVVEHLRQCYRSASTRFDYHQNDLLVIDNMLVSHGREPFTGGRRIAVAMTEAYQPA